MEREKMDRNQDGKIADDELGSYLLALSDEVEQAVSISVDDKTLPLVSLYEPKVLSRSRLVTDQGFHAVRVYLFARTPEGLRAGSRIRVGDHLWLNYPAILSVDAVGQGDIDVMAEPGARMTPAGFDGAPRLVDIRCLAVPPLPGADGAATFSLDLNRIETQRPSSLGAVIWVPLFILPVVLAFLIIRSRNFAGGQS
jgi:hypothetical protein